MIRTQSVLIKQPIGSTTKLPLESPGYEQMRSADLEINTYLPSLYLKKCRKVENLDRMRNQFPSVENFQTNANKPQQRPLTAWDHVLLQVQHEAHIRHELKKHEIALKIFLAKKCQLKFKSRELKRQQVTCFHRILASHLAERVANRFADVKAREPANSVIQPQIKAERTSSAGRDASDVFIQGEDERVFNNDNNNLFEDLLLEPTTVKKQQDTSGVSSIDAYILRIIELQGVQTQPVKIKRREMFRKIKENLKKRQKYKERSNPNAPKTGAADLILAGLINNEPQDQSVKDIIGITRNMSTSSAAQDLQKKRRRKDDGFVLNWEEEDYEYMPKAKKFIEGRNLKFDNLNEMLSLFVLRDPKNEHFAKSFEKTIENDKQFPRRLQAVQPEQLDSIGRQESFFDRDYETFVERNGCNMESLIKHFTQVSEFLFPDQIDMSSRNHKLALQVKQLFTAGGINSEGKVLRYDKGMVHIMDQEYFKSNGVLKNLVDLRELYFLIEYYLAQFGNNWTLVTECLRLNPFARSMMLSRQHVENLHAYFNMKRGKNITCKDRLLLPFSNEFQQGKMPVVPENQQIEFDLDNYDELIQKECSNARNSHVIQQMQVDHQFAKFEQYCQTIGVLGNRRTIIDSLLSDHREMLSTTLSEWLASGQNKPYIERKAQKTEYAYQSKATLSKGVKIAVMKKRKVVSDRTSPLVQTLAKIKNRQQQVPPTVPPSNYKKFDPSVVVNPIAPAAVIQPPVNIVKTESVIKSAPPKVEKEAPQLKKIRQDKKEDTSKTPKKVATQKGEDKKSGQKDRKKKDDKK